MSLTASNIVQALELLDRQLALKNEKRILIACGGGVLSVMGVISRETRDLDVISPILDPMILSCAQSVASQLGLDPEWLNNGPSGFTRDLEKGWELRTETVFGGQFLVVKALGRRDLIATKLQGLCDRDERDLEDILALKPVPSEIESLKNWLLSRDASPLWPKRVDSQLKKLLARVSGSFGSKDES